MKGLKSQHYILLLYLLHNPGYGWKIAEDFRGLNFPIFKDLCKAHKIYPFLHELKDLGYIQDKKVSKCGRPTNKEGKRRKQTRYFLTPKLFKEARYEGTVKCLAPEGITSVLEFIRLLSYNSEKTVLKSTPFISRDFKAQQFFSYVSQVLSQLNEYSNCFCLGGKSIGRLEFVFPSKPDRKAIHKFLNPLSKKTIPRGCVVIKKGVTVNIDSEKRMLRIKKYGLLDYSKFDKARKMYLKKNRHPLNDDFLSALNSFCNQVRVLHIGAMHE